MNRARRVLDGAHEVEIVFAGVEFVDMGKDLRETKRQHNRPVGALLVHHVDGDVPVAADCAKGDVSCVEAPVLRQGRPRRY